MVPFTCHFRVIGKTEDERRAPFDLSGRCPEIGAVGQKDVGQMYLCTDI